LLLFCWFLLLFLNSARQVLYLLSKPPTPPADAQFFTRRKFGDENAVSRGGKGRSGRRETLLLGGTDRGTRSQGEEKAIV
jgi:hypothetical protein